MFGFSQSIPVEVSDRFPGISGVELVDSIAVIPYAEMTSDMNRSEKLFSFGIELARKEDHKRGLADCLAQQQIVVYLQGDHERSLKLGIEAIGLYEELGEKGKVGALYGSIGYSMKRRDLEKANQFMQRGIRILENLEDQQGIDAVYNNYGVVKEMGGQLDSAAYYYQKSLQIVQERNDSLGIPYSLNNLAGVYLLKNEPQKAKPLYDQAFAIRLALKNEYGILENTVLYGDYHAASANIDSALHYFNLAIDQTYQVGYPYIRQYCFEQISELHKQSGRFEAALVAKDRFLQLKDSLQGVQRTDELAKMETRFETAQKEKENQTLKRETAEQQLAISNQRQWITGLGFFILLLAALALIIIQRNRQKAQAERDAAVIAEREAGLNAVLQATEEERQRIAKDLHDGVVQSLTGLRLGLAEQSRRVKNEQPELGEKLSESSSGLDETIAELRNISHQMMPRALQESGLVPALSDMLEKSLGNTDIQFEFEHHGVDDKRFDERKEISLYRIAQELVNNIIKHSEARAVSVQLLATKSHLMLVVEDNGKGFEYEDKANRNGIGLMNISSRVQAVHGELNYQPGPDQGTVATVRVPLVPA